MKADPNCVRPFSSQAPPFLSFLSNRAAHLSERTTYIPKKPPWLRNPSCFCIPFHSQPWTWENTEDLVERHATVKHLQRLNGTSLQPKCSQYSLAHLIKALSLKAVGSLSTPTAFLECSPNRILTPTILQTLPTPRTFHRMHYEVYGPALLHKRWFIPCQQFCRKRG